MGRVEFVCVYMYIGQNSSPVCPERQAEEGKVGPDFLPTSVHAKPVNYPVGKPLEVGSKISCKSRF